MMTKIDRPSRELAPTVTSRYVTSPERNVGAGANAGELKTSRRCVDLDQERI